MRYGFFSDVHSNEEALVAVIKDFEEQKLDKIYFLGDAVGYGASPNECVKLIKQAATKCLMGNHDYATLGLLDTDFFNQYAKDSINWTKTVMNDKSLEFLSNYLLCVKLEDFHMVHSTPKEPENWHYILNLSEAEDNFSYFSKSVCLIGHSHRPVIIKKYKDRHCFIHNDTCIQIEEDFRYLINIGSVGQPRDGNNQACYLIYDSDNRTTSLRRVSYDIKKAQRKMKKANLPQYLIERLVLGR